MKKIFLTLSLLAAGLVWADGATTYNDLGTYADQETEFWNTKNHPKPGIYVASQSVGVSVTTQVATSDAQTMALDTRLSTFCAAVFEKFITRPFGSLLFFR